MFEVNAYLEGKEKWWRAQGLFRSGSLVNAIEFAEAHFARWEIVSDFQDEPLLWKDETGLHVDLESQTILLLDLCDAVGLFVNGDITKERLEEIWNLVRGLIPFYRFLEMTKQQRG